MSLELGLGLRRGSATGTATVSIPSEFGWTPDFTISGSGVGGYTTSYNPENDKPSGTTYWIDSTNGNDTTGDGSEGNPYKTLAKGVTEGGVVLNIKSGNYWRNDGLPLSFNPSSSIALVAIDGVGTVRMGRIEDPSDLTWSDEGSGAYSTTRPSVRTVLDLTAAGDSDMTLADGVTDVPIPFTEVADLAAVQASSGNAWAQVGSTLYVKTFDSRQPDGDVLPILIEENMEIVNKNITLYIEGIDIWGDQPLYMDYGVDNTAKCVTVDSTFGYSGDFDNYYIDGVEDVRNIRCKVYYQISSDDGFNYDKNSIAPSYVHILEQDCEGMKCGDGTNDNASTTHDTDTFIIRVNGNYHNQDGPAVADTAGARALNYGVTATDSYIGIQVGTAAAGIPAIQWNKDCSVSNISQDGRSRASGGIQFDLGGNTWKAGDKRGSNNYIDLVAYPDMEDVLMSAPEAVLGVYCALDTDMYVTLGGTPDEVNNFHDLSAFKTNATALRSGIRAIYSATAVNGLAGWVINGDAADDDTSYSLSRSNALYSLAFVGTYQDGVQATFTGNHCLLTGSSAATIPRIMGSNGNNALSTSGDFTNGFSRDGGAEDTSPLPMPLDYYSAVSDTGAAQTDTYNIYGSQGFADGRAWVGTHGFMIMFNRALTTGEELAIRTAVKNIYGL